MVISLIRRDIDKSTPEGNMLPINKTDQSAIPLFQSFIRDSVDVPRQKGKNATACLSCRCACHRNRFQVPTENQPIPIPSPEGSAPASVEHERKRVQVYSKKCEQNHCPRRRCFRPGSLGFSQPLANTITSQCRRRTIHTVSLLGARTTGLGFRDIDD